MKRIIIILTIFALSACNLNQFPYSEMAAKDAIKDQIGVNNLVIGTYNSLYGVMYYEWAMTELRSDNARMRLNNSTSADSKLIEQLDQSVVITANSWVQDYWDKSYVAISRANNVLASLHLVQDERLRAQFEGEARFVRALVYFNLVRLWGPVFIVTKKTGADEARYMQRSPVEDVYALIEEDLTAVVEGNLLPETMPSAMLGRADINAAKSLLAKVYITRYKVSSERYTKAKNLLADVLSSKGEPKTASALVPYDQIFDPSNELNSEIIFAVRYRSGNLGLGSPFSTLFGPINNGGNVVIGAPKHYNFPSDDLIAAYEPGDRRKDVTLRESYYNATLARDIESRYCNKFIQTSMLNEYDAENDWPIIRLADIMLLYAEVSNELVGPSEEAIAYLNAIRQRAGIPEYSSSELASKYDLRTAIRKERRVELAMENHRWFDLLRWGDATQTINAYLASEVFYSEYSYVVNPIKNWQLLLPIPISVININKEVAQNPGY